MTQERLQEIREHLDALRREELGFDEREGHLMAEFAPEVRGMLEEVLGEVKRLRAENAALHHHMHEFLAASVVQTEPVRLLGKLRAAMLEEARQKFGTDTMTWDDFATAPVPRREGPAPAIGYHGSSA